MEILWDKLLERVHGGEIPTKLELLNNQQQVLAGKPNSIKPLDSKEVISTLADNLGSQAPRESRVVKPG